MCKLLLKRLKLIQNVVLYFINTKGRNTFCLTANLKEELKKQ